MPSLGLQILSPVVIKSQLESTSPFNKLHVIRAAAAKLGADCPYTARRSRG